MKGYEHMKYKSSIKAFLTAVIMMLLFMSVSAVPSGYSAGAASVDYPAVLLRISTHDNSRHLNISGYDDKAAVVASALKNTQNENWRFDYVGTDSKGSFYKLTNMGTGRLLTPSGYSVKEGTDCIIYGSESAKSQHWYVIPVEKDSYGNDLFYKIVNYENTDLAITNNSNKITLSAFSGRSEQKWLLNAAGLQGFAGYSKDMNGRTKACTLGGTLGKTVEVRTFDELKKACTSSEACTVLITADIRKKGNYTKDSNGRYRFSDAVIYLQPNKTIIGSYSANSLYNVYFRTYNEKNGPGNNIIIRNIKISHDKELNNDNIWEFAYGTNFWIDHCEFAGHSGVNTASTKLDDWDKFLNFKGTTDFISISDCRFGLHEYGVLLGYPADDEATYRQYNNHPLVTLADNCYIDTMTRAPGLMRYGYFHSLNNYVENFSMGYTVHTASKVFAENCYYKKGGNIVCDWNEVTYPGSFADSGSKVENAKRAKPEGYAKNCTWRPSQNYSYSAKTADEAKNYCLKYSGAQSSASNYTYAVFTKTGYPSAGYVTKPSVPMDGPSVKESPSPEPETTEPSPSLFPETVKGDVNKDGKLDAADLVSVLNYFAGTGTPEDVTASDINGDGRTDITDIILMKQILTGDAVPEPPVSETPAPSEELHPSVSPSPSATKYEPDGFKFSGRVFVVGDSTVCNYDSNYSKNYNRYGWGMKIGEQLGGVTVENLALSGRSSRSFLTEKNYQTLKNSIGAGDYLLIQFGHNDEKTDEGKYPGLGTWPGLDWNTLDNTGKDSSGRYSYEYILTAYYINLAKNKGAVPVLVTPVTRRASDGQANYRQHEPYSQGMLKLGEMYSVPVVDMTSLTAQLYTNLYNYGGAAETAKLHCWADEARTQIDNTHLSSAGAAKIAQMIAEQMQKLGLSAAR